MKTRGIIDLYLPRKAAYHVKIVVGSALATAFTGILKGPGLSSHDIQAIFILFIVQFEIYIWLGTRFFNINFNRPAKEIPLRIILRLIVFYFIVLIISAALMVLFTLIEYWIHGITVDNLVVDLFNRESRGFLVGFSGGVLFGTIVFFFYQWRDALKREQNLKEEKLIFRYETLKSQVRPHFLFNSLNTLSSMIDNNEQATKFIQKLSGIYRYMLDNIEKNTVNLQDELSFARDYFYVQQIRDEEKIRMIIEDFQVSSYRILPISIQILIENALKHNSATRENPLTIRIALDNNECIIISNDLRKKMNLERSNGIGLKNLGERIRLATGREIKIKEDINEFSVSIPLIKE